ncbi:UNVERIFIED_CONTAM: hypothetical protein K2H54_068783 [Gekko kuhli]
MHKNVINVRENVVPRSWLQTLPHPYHVCMTDGRRGVKALGSPHESVLLPPKGESKLIPARVMKLDRVERIGQINHTIKAGSSSNGSHDFIVLSHNRRYGRSGGVQGPEINSHSPSHTVSLQDRPERGIADGLHGLDDTPLQEPLDCLSNAYFSVNGAFILSLRQRVPAFYEDASIANSSTFRLVSYPYFRKFLDPRVRSDPANRKGGFQGSAVMDSINKVRTSRNLPQEAVGQVNARGRNWLLHTRVRGRRCTRTLRSHCRWRRRLLCLLRGGRARWDWLR